MDVELSVEDQWLEEARGGDAAAFGRLVELHTPRLHGYVARYIFDPEDVLDIVQDSFVDAFNGLAGYDPERPFLPWLHTICKHRMFKFLRRNRQRRSQTHQLVDVALLAQAEHDDVEQVLESERCLAALEQCLARLEDPQRELIRWRYVHGHTVPAIAVRLQSSVDSIGMRLSRLRAALRRCIEGRLNASEQGAS